MLGGAVKYWAYIASPPYTQKPKNLGKILENLFKNLKNFPIQAHLVKKFRKLSTVDESNDAYDSSDDVFDSSNDED